MRKTKLFSFIIVMAIGGFIGLQSTLSSTAKAETETVPIFIRDTVTNTIIDKRIVMKTDTLVRTVNIITPVRDELWAAKAVRRIPLQMKSPFIPVEEHLAKSIASVPID